MFVRVDCGRCGFPLTEKGGTIQVCPFCHTENTFEPGAISSSSVGTAILKVGAILGAAFFLGYIVFGRNQP